VECPRAAPEARRVERDVSIGDRWGTWCEGGRYSGIDVSTSQPFYPTIITKQTKKTHSETLYFYANSSHLAYSSSKPPGPSLLDAGYIESWVRVHCSVLSWMPGGRYRILWIGIGQIIRCFVGLKSGRSEMTLVLSVSFVATPEGSGAYLLIALALLCVLLMT